MPLAPVGRLKKKEIEWLASHRCKHYHTYLEHYQCYLAENPQNLKIGFFDIETSNLKADFGVMFCYCIKEGGKRNILHRTVTKEEINACLDKEVVRQCVEDIKKFDRIVTYYGKRFDVPFLRTRALYHGIDFPDFGSIIHDDIYFIIRNRFQLSRNRMKNACRTLIGKTEKTHINPLYWLKALQGDEQSLKWILDHCKRDVRDLERLYDKVISFSRRQDCSI